MEQRTARERLQERILVHAPTSILLVGEPRPSSQVRGPNTYQYQVDERSYLGSGIKVDCWRHATINYNKFENSPHAVAGAPRRSKKLGIDTAAGRIRPFYNQDPEGPRGWKESRRRSMVDGRRMLFVLVASSCTRS